MTPIEAQRQVESIRHLANDDGQAHALEDSLYEAVLRAIAAGSGYARHLAEVALTTKGIDFARWYE